MVRKSKTFKLADLPTALVVGGAGFIGSHLCRALLQRQSRVFCLDRVTAKKKENIQLIVNHRCFHLVKLAKKEPLKNLKREKFDYIFLLTSKGKKPWAVPEILELAKKQNAKLLVLSSIILNKTKKTLKFWRKNIFLVLTLTFALFA